MLGGLRFGGMERAKSKNRTLRSLLTSRVRAYCHLIDTQIFGITKSWPRACTGTVELPKFWVVSISRCLARAYCSSNFRFLQVLATGSDRSAHGSSSIGSATKSPHDGGLNLKFSEFDNRLGNSGLPGALNTKFCEVRSWPEWCFASSMDRVRRAGMAAAP